MTIIFSRASQSYPPKTYSITRTVPAGAVVNQVKVTCTREAWPVGPVGNVVLTFPDGTTAGFSMEGGDVPTRDKSGILAASSCMFEKQDLQGNPIPFPAGDYTLNFEVLQAINTALTIERF